MKIMTFTVAMLDYFGKHPNQTNLGFMTEIKALSPEERQFFVDNLPSVGYTLK